MEHSLIVLFRISELGFLLNSRFIRDHWKVSLFLIISSANVKALEWGFFTGIFFPKTCTPGRKLSLYGIHKCCSSQLLQFWGFKYTCILTFVIKWNNGILLVHAYCSWIGLLSRRLFSDFFNVLFGFWLNMNPHCSTRCLLENYCRSQWCLSSDGSIALALRLRYFLS